MAYLDSGGHTINNGVPLDCLMLLLKPHDEWLEVPIPTDHLEVPLRGKVEGALSRVLLQTKAATAVSKRASK